MAFDWKRLDREERSRGYQQAFGLGIGFLAVALVGLPVGYALGRPGPALDFAIVALVIGLPTLVVGLRGRRRDRGQGDD